MSVPDWLESWVDVASGRLMGLLKSVSFCHIVSEVLFLGLNFTSVLRDVIMIVRVWKLMWVDNEWFMVLWRHDSSMSSQASVVSLTKFVSMAKFGVYGMSEAVVLREVFVSCLPFIAVMAESIGMSNSMVSMIEVAVVEGWSVKTKFLVWKGHVMVWLSVESVLNEVVAIMMRVSMSPDGICLLLWLHSLLIIGSIVLHLSSESSLILVWSQLMVSVWFIHELLVVVDGTVLWHVVGLNVVCWSICIVVWDLGMTPGVMRCLV